MDSPLISIIIPVYNNEKYIANAVNSIKKQSFKDWEMIIVDDGSTDKTIEKIKSLNIEDIFLKEMHNRVDMIVFEGYYT